MYFLYIGTTSLDSSETCIVVVYFVPILFILLYFGLVYHRQCIPFSYPWGNIVLQETSLTHINSLAHLLKFYGKIYWYTVFRDIYKSIVDLHEKCKKFLVGDEVLIRVSPRDSLLEL